MLFPDLFPNGHGYYGEGCLTTANNQAETYGKYIKNRMLCYDS